MKEKKLDIDIKLTTRATAELELEILRELLEEDKSIAKLLEEEEKDEDKDAGAK